MEITFVVDDLNYNEFKSCFLKEHPVPSDFALSEDEWVQEWGRRQYLVSLERGKQKLIQEQSKVDERIIQCRS